MGLLTIAVIVAGARPGVAEAERAGSRLDPASYRDQPPLAYVSAGQVFILDGKGHPPRRVDRATGACCVAWAPDGTSVAFQRGSELWITREDGTGTRRVARNVRKWSWAPDGEAIAVTPNPAPIGGATGIDFYAVERPRARVTQLRGYRVLDFAWAGLGRRLAVSALPPAGSGPAALFMLEVAGPYGDCADLCPEPAQPVAMDPSTGGPLDVYFAAWSPTVSAIALWTGPADAAPAGGAIELSLLSPAGGARTQLARTIVDRAWIRWSPGGDRLLVVDGSGRDRDSAHVLKLCAPPLACRVVSGPTVSAADPAWSGDGRMAYVLTRRSSPTGPVSAPGTAEPSTGLWVADGDAARAQLVAAGAVSAPHWLPDTRHLVFVRDHQLWLVNADRGDATAIAGVGDGRTAPSASRLDGDRLFAVAP